MLPERYWRSSARARMSLLMKTCILPYRCALFGLKMYLGLVKELLDLEAQNARQTLGDLNAKYPIVITRDLAQAKQWLRSQARGSERYGIVVSSQAERLKPHAIDVKSPMDPVHWFLDGKEDLRSSYYLEDVATEFHVQGLDLDWAWVTWDADFRYGKGAWAPLRL